MTTVTGSGFPQDLWGWFYDYFTIQSYGPTGFTATSLGIGGSTITVTGSGLDYSFTPDPYDPNAAIVAITAGTITGITLANGGSGNESFSNFNISGVAANAALISSQSDFNNLFFGGDDTFTWSDTPGSTIRGYGGNDTFNISHWGLATADPYDVVVDGGAGTDTLNVTGGVTNAGDYEGITFNVVGVEQINLGAGYNYNLVVGGGFSSSGNTVTVDASALGASNSFSFQSITFSAASALAGNLVLIGGAGNDSFQAGAGANTFIGNGGSDTVSFFTAYLYAPPVGVTANLSISGFQSLGTGRGTASFSGIENLTGTPYDDTLTGNAGNNVLNVGNSNQPGLIDPHFGNDVLNGGAGFDTAVLPGAMSDYTIATAGGTTTLVSSWGTATLTGVEQIQFDDQTMSTSNGGVTVSHAPVITTSNISSTRYQEIAVSSLFNISNPSQEAITYYQLWDATADPNSGYFRVNGVAQAAGAVITITAAQMAQTTFVTRQVSDSLQIRALNAAGWSAGDNASWAPFTISVSDTAPVVTTHNVNAKVGKHIALTSLISISDADGDSMTAYQLWDATSDPNSGYWVVNGLAQAAGTVINISESQHFATYFVTGSVADNLQVRASDGIKWSAADNASWSPFTVTPVANTPPVVTTANQILYPYQTTGYWQYPPFQVSDADSDTITNYQFQVTTIDPDAGYLLYNGVPVANGTPLEVTAAQVGNVSFVTGVVPTQEQIRAFDGTDWSAWSPFTISPPADTPPVVTTHDLARTPGGTSALSSLFSISGGNYFVKYQIWDGTSDSNAGYITINGVRQAAGLIELTDTQMAQASFTMGTVATRLQVRVFDGIQWSAPSSASWAPFTVSPAVNHPPVMVAGSGHAAPGTALSLSSLFTVSDPDGDTITKYQLWDSSTDYYSGYFLINGNPQGARSVIEISASQLSQVSFVVGSFPDAPQIRAFDGQNWSSADNVAWTAPTVTPVIPVVTTTDRSGAIGQSLAISSLFNATSANGAIVFYQFLDTTTDPNSGYLTLNGTPQTAGTVLQVSAGQLGQVAFVVGHVSDTLQIRVFDGAAFSTPDSSFPGASVTISSPGDTAPVVTTSNKTMAVGATAAFSTLFNVSDADGDAMTKYQIWDATRDPNAGYVTINGVKQPAAALIELTLTEMAQASFVMGSVPTALQIRAFDGQKWSAADSASWSPFTVSPPPDTAPVVTTSNKTMAPGSTAALSTLFNVSDADGDTMTRYQIWDGTRDPSAGYVTIGGVPQPAGLIDITAAQLTQTSFVAGTVATGLQIRAFDGQKWSAGDNANWAPFTVSPPPDNAPVLTTSNKAIAVGATVALSTLFNVSDADGDSMTKYQIWDGMRDPNAGYVTIAGVQQAAPGLIELTATQMAQASFVMGTAATNLQIRAFDGQKWSAADNASWAPFTVSPQPNTPPVVTTSNKTMPAGATVGLSGLFTVGDADGDAITKYQLWEATRDPNAGYVTINRDRQPAGALIEMTGAQMAQATFVVGTVATNLQIRAFDGKDWSAADNVSWSPFTVSPGTDHAPVVTTTDKTATAGQSFALSSLFSVSDADGDTMAKYQLWDGTAAATSGHFVVGGQTQSAGTLIEISAAQISQASFVAGQSAASDLLQIRAFDGFAWSAADNASWAPFHINVS